ncbi:MAG: glycosyltransferase [Nostocales cyanobacterium]|nr:MAG: glycosyltransferase [Nostocales cyanobacterium]
MRILFISSSSGSRGGGELYLIYLGKELAKRGFTVGLWCSANPNMDELANLFAEFGQVLRSPYKNTYNLKFRSLEYIFINKDQNYKNIISQWQEFKPDIIHLNKQNLEDGLDLLDWINHLSIPSVTTIHITQTQATLGAFLGFFRDIIAKSALKKYHHHIVAISENRGIELKKIIQEQNLTLSKIKVINNGVYVPETTERLKKRELSRSQMKLNPENLLIIAVGRMEEQKQPLLFLQWANYLRQHISSVRFLWVGDGRLNSLWDQWVLGNNAQEYIQRIGWQNDVTPFLAAADVFFHPAAFEGLPFALLEAMAWYLPCVITSDLANELKFPSDSYFVISTDNRFEELNKLLTPEAINTVSDTGYHLIKNKFSLNKMVNNYISLYQDSQILFNSQLRNI